MRLNNWGAKIQVSDNHEIRPFREKPNSLRAAILIAKFSPNIN
jgi:hypothetical protein